MENIFELVGENFNKYQNNVAFVINQVSYTYKDLEEKTHQISALIQSLDIDPQEIVGVVTHDDLETYATILALFNNRLVYLPIHPNHPENRNNEILKDSGAKLVLTSQNMGKDLPENYYNTSTLSITNQKQIIKKEFNQQDLAYILYTSGSTGKPKGVCISHENFISFKDSFNALDFEITAKDRCLQCFDITFDVGIQAFLIPLFYGATVYTVPHDVMKFAYVYELLEDEKLTIAVMAPSMLKLLKPYFNDINLPHLRVSILTAEASHTELVKEWSKCIPKAKIYNLYGPTECTVYCVGYDITDVSNIKDYAGLVAIGKTFKNVEIAIMDPRKEEFLDGSDWGELCLAGNQLTKGYWNNEKLNSEKFFIKNDVVYYKTGDRCKIEDDILLYGGRLDNQVKLQGFRVELGEIEHKISEIIKSDVVAITYNETINTQLALFYQNNELSKEEIIKICENNLPSYMMPNKLEHITDFPLNVNQKIDRIALKKIFLKDGI